MGWTAYDASVTPWSTSNARSRLLAWSIIGIVGWLGAIAIGAALWSAEPRSAGFDWELIVDAGRRVTAGLSPYDPDLLAGQAHLVAVDLFYSYPPPVAQAAAFVAGVPTLASLLALDGLAVIGAALVAAILARARPDLRGLDVVLPTVAVLPLLFPVTVALIFGNVDVLYPLVYGTLLLSAVGAGSGRVTTVAGGIALAVAAMAKIHPGGIALWLLVRGSRERRNRMEPRSWVVLLVALAAGLVILVTSLLVGGGGPWQDYLRVIGVAADADVVVRANIGPAAQVALAAGLDADAARGLYFVTLSAALGVTIAAAWRIADTMLSLAIGATASLILLPITWFHYPSALIPFAVAAIIRSAGGARPSRVIVLVFLAGLVASLTIVLPVAVWIAVGLVIAAVAESRPAAQPTPSGLPVATA